MKFISACLLALPLLAHADIEGRVVSIADGDTLTVLVEGNTRQRVRLTGIDAPEKRQPFYQRSKQALSDCAYDKQVHVEGDKFDRYRRLVGRVVVDQADCNLQQVKIGLAWHYKAYAREQAPIDRVRYAEAEVDARSKRVGLWTDPDPVEPWKFRHQ